MSERAYTMTVAGQLFRHLGLQMYSGAVPAIAELISNAYDAMARNVWIKIPTGRPLQENDEVAVTDDGHGMTFDDCNGHYLHVGRNRRGSQAGRTAPYNDLEPRRVQGRKGIGKLAAFGIADRIGVRTIKDREVAHFALDYSELTRNTDFADSAGYTPETLQDDGQPTDEAPGTAIILSRLKITRRIDANEFKRSIARRLLVLDDSFRVYVNGSLISRDEIPFQFRVPEITGSWETCRLPDGNSLKWWAGFCKNTIPDEEMRGFVVYVRGKLAQAPWFFDLSGGVWGQHGMQYLTGEIRADYLDDHRDLIATDRGAVRWEDPMAAPLKAWGQSKVRNLLEEWTVKRRRAKITNPRVIIYIERAKRLPPREEWEKQYLMRLATVSVRRNQWTRLSRVPSQHRIVSVAVRGTTGFLAVTADGVLWYLSDKQSVEPNGILGIGDSSTSNWRWTRDSSTPFPGTVGNPSRETVVVAPTESDSTP